MAGTFQVTREHTGEEISGKPERYDPPQKQCDAWGAVFTKNLGATTPCSLWQGFVVCSDRFVFLTVLPRPFYA